VAARINSPNIDCFASDYQIAHKFRDWREMAIQGKLDALIVATSWEGTGSVATEVIQAGVPVLIEKPLALSSGKVGEILSATREFHNQVMVGYNRRFYDFIPRLKDMIGAYPLMSIELNCPDGFEESVKRYGEMVREHILVYKTSHWLDLLMCLVGSVEVVAMYRKSRGTPAYNGMLQSSAGVPIHLQANFDAPAQLSLTFNFENFICQLRPAEVLRIYEELSLSKETVEVPYRRYDPKPKEEQATDFRYKPGFLNQVRHFIETCVEKKGEEWRGCSLQDALRVTELCEGIRGTSMLASKFC
jgi:predicted dehydrogenase